MKSESATESVGGEKGKTGPKKDSSFAFAKTPTYLSTQDRIGKNTPVLTDPTSFLLCFLARYLPSYLRFVAKYPPTRDVIPCMSAVRKGCFLPCFKLSCLSGSC